MKKNLLVLIALAFTTSCLFAQATKEFPAHWGKPPAIQTRDYVELPAGYGRGSSTLAKWIAGNLAKDKSGDGDAAPTPAKPLYENNFEQADAGQLPDGFLALNGEFVVKEEGGNKFLELPGTPLDSFAVLFGPTETADWAVSARIFGTTKGRRSPTFGVGLGGVGGYKLQVSPGKKALELLRDQDVKASVAFDWPPGAWVHLRLQLRKIKDGEWKIEGKVWPDGSAEPAEWLVTFTDQEAPPPGRASVLGSPFAGTPIWYDDLRVTAIAPAQGASAAR
jgi:hypothetical protein